jgi:hypothetical protein
MKKVTVKQAITDLMNQFMCVIVEKKFWTSEDIEKELKRAIYLLALEYLSTDEDNEEVKY